MVLMTNKEVANDGHAGNYAVLDWRSWKLARAARSTLSAESQAASEAADLRCHLLEPHLVTVEATERCGDRQN